MTTVAPFESSDTGPVVLERQFHENNVRLTEAGLYIFRPSSKKERQFIGISEIFACELVKQQKICRFVAAVELQIHAYVDVATKKATNDQQREKIVLSLKFDGETAMTDAKEWEQAIVKLCCTLSEQKFLVFINPNSGAGKAHQIFTESIEPMFRLAGVQYDVKITERAMYTHDYVRDTDNTSYTGIIICAGDGLLYEVVNGLVARRDWPTIAQRITLGIVPCGSGNGLVATMNHKVKGDPIINAGLAIIRNNTSKMDLVRVQTETKTIHSFLSITWGYMAAVDIRSEAIKSWAGNARFTIWALKDLLFLKQYKATVSYLPHDIQNDAPFPSNLTATLSNEWITVEDSFLGVTAAYQSHLSPELHIAPESTLNDGIIWLLLLRSSLTRYKFLSFLLKIESGTHLKEEKDPDIQMIKCKALRIVPKCTDGCIAIDGEEIPFGPIQAEIIPSIAKVYTPSVLEQTTTTTRTKNL